MLVVIRGAGDIATGIALRPYGMLFGSDSIGRNSR